MNKLEIVGLTPLVEGTYLLLTAEFYRIEFLSEVYPFDQLAF